jgi:putative alpha-1,2-mannosidase
MPRLARHPQARLRSCRPRSGQQPGRDYYDSRGWIPADKIFESVSRTLEYAYDDHAMAVIADKVGAHEDAQTLRKRALNYAHLFDAQRGFMRPGSTMDSLPNLTIRSHWAIPRNGAILPRATAGRRPSSTSTMSTA